MSQTIPSADLQPSVAEDEVIFPPGDLWSDEPPLESDLHREQIDLLIRLLRWWWRDRQDFYASGNLTIYYSEDKITTRDFRGPDFLWFWGQSPRNAAVGWSGRRMANTPTSLSKFSLARPLRLIEA